MVDDECNPPGWLMRREDVPVQVVEVRAAAPADLPALAGIFRRASLSNTGDRSALLEHPDALRLPADLLDRRRTRVALVDGVITGFASTTTSGVDTVELDDLFVDPEAMRQGIARRLVRLAADEARRDGAVRIDVTANPHALAFYSAVGFDVDGSVDTEFGPGVRMHLDLCDR